LVSGFDTVSQLDQVKAIIGVQLQSTSLIAKAEEAGLELEGLSTRTATLEDVFIQMTGRSLREQ
jgi:hypothetical protein